MKNEMKSIIILCNILIAFTFTTIGQELLPPKIDSLIMPFAKAEHFSGVVLVSKDDKIIYEKAFGLANVEHNVPNRLDTKFGIASINKPMTSVILVSLMEQGKIKLEDKLSKYIPDFPNGDKITIEMLGRHRSGIPHRIMPEREESKRYTPAQFVEKVKLAKLLHEPGSKYLYSSAGYSVLARTLEIASGKPFNELLKEYVFDPAGMDNSVDYDSRKIIKNRAECYLLETDGYTALPLKDYSFLVGAGSVFSTARDIYKFGKASIDGKYGEIAKLNLVRDGGVFLGNGSTYGFRSNIRIDSGKKYGYVLVSNLGSGANDLILKGLRGLLEGQKIEQTFVPNPVVNNNIKNNLTDYIGLYNLGGSGFEILINEEQLFAGPYKLLPIGKDKFYSFWSYAEITFVRDETGKVNGLTWIGSGGKSEWTKK
jgi:CubicO group peptidase (beta-lactamase class C family)